IIQESLRNVGKHSEASMARVLLTYGPVGRCRVVIEDDGSGFEPTEAQLEDSEHFGLSIMHERAAAIGAELKVESEPGEGTTVFLEFDAPEMSAEPQRAEETR
ncbi:MAG: ATP-binding protein, partial [Pseudomonadota bacterium]|nr:ATP-binding protein [Pseudomonadota bacterium]